MSSSAPSGSGSGARTAKAFSDAHEGRQAKRAKTGDASKPWTGPPSSPVPTAFESLEQQYRLLLRSVSPAKVVDSMKKELDGKREELGAFFVWKCKIVIKTLLESRREDMGEAVHASKRSEAVALAKGSVTLRPTDNEAKYHAAYALKLAGHSEPALKLLEKAPRTDHWSSALGQLESRCQLQSVVEILPEHLFVDILALLQTHELAQASVVCRRWNSVANTPYLWRNLSFISQSRIRHDGAYVAMYNKGQRKLFGHGKVPWDSIIARAKGRLVSVDLAYIPHKLASELIGALLKASSGLKHIRWSVPPGSMVTVQSEVRKPVARQVLELAQVCPHIATLEVMCDEPLSAPLWSSGTLQSAKLERFRTDSALPRDAFPHLSKMLSQAKSVALYAGASPTPLRERWLLDLLSSNIVIKEFVGHDFRDLSLGETVLAELAGQPTSAAEAVATGITTSLSLKKLDLRHAAIARVTEVRLHAPKLRELAVDARLLCKFSDETISALSTLHLQIHMHQSKLNTHAGGAMEMIQRVTGYTGHLTLELGRYVTEHVWLILDLLASEFIWPGLTSVTLTLPEASTAEASISGALTRVIAARKAGARGASSEQYKAIATGTTSAVSSSANATAASTLQSSSNPFRRGAAAASTSSTTKSTTAKMTFTGPPLCKDVQWEILNFQALPPETVAWLRAENVRLGYLPSWD